MDAYIDSFWTEPYFPYVAAGVAVVLLILIALLVSTSTCDYMLPPLYCYCGATAILAVINTFYNAMPSCYCDLNIVYVHIDVDTSDIADECT